MGKQVTFFMTHEDEKKFLDAIQQLGPVRLIYNAFAEASKMEVQSLHPVGTTSNDANLSLVNDAVASHIQHEFFPTSGSHCINLSESNVVQFNRCKPIKTWLANGRLWFDEKSNRERKSAAFLKWASSLLKWVQANYCKDARGYFIGPHAFELSKAGKLLLGPSVESELSLEERKRALGLQ